MAKWVYSMASSGTQIPTITPRVWSSFSYFKTITLSDSISIFKAEDGENDNE